jgi:carbohydrate-selective porin OprB
MPDMRTETDSLGAVEVPADKLWGAQTQRSLEHFSIASFNTEHAFEFNALLDVAPMILLQPVFQYYLNAGGGANAAAVVGFRTKVEF